MLTYTPPTGIFVLLVFALCGSYVHFRGKLRHSLMRQLFDHSTIVAPINCLMYLFSKLPAQPYHSVDHFPELQILRDNWQVIRDEAITLDDQQKITESNELDDIGFNSFFRTGWKRFYLTWYGSSLKSADALCPKTVALLKSVPSIKAAMFASLPPGARLVKHRDPYAGSLRYHLGLVTPGTQDCAIHVDGEPYVWQDGEDVVFDETFIHYAENKSQHNRIVLFCDIERPLWFAPARWLNTLFARIVMAAAVTKNMPGDKVGGLNKAFGQLYKIRQVGKSIKKYNRKLYYALKYLLFTLIIYLIFF